MVWEYLLWMTTKDVKLVPRNMTTWRLDDLHCENNIVGAQTCILVRSSCVYRSLCVGAFGADSSIPLFFMLTVVDVKRRKQSICLLLVIFPRFDCLSCVYVFFNLFRKLYWWLSINKTSKKLCHLSQIYFRSFAVKYVVDYKMIIRFFNWVQVHFT